MAYTQYNMAARSIYCSNVWPYSLHSK